MARLVEPWSGIVSDERTESEIRRTFAWSVGLAVATALLVVGVILVAVALAAGISDAWHVLLIGVLCIGVWGVAFARTIRGSLRQRTLFSPRE